MDEIEAPRLKLSKIPPLEPFEEIILKWNFTDSLKDECNVPVEEMQARIGEGFTLCKIPTFFESAEEYLDAFYPVFLLECLQNVYKAKDTEIEEFLMMTQVASWTHKRFTLLKFDRPKVFSTVFSTGDLLLLAFGDGGVGGQFDDATMKGNFIKIRDQEIYENRHMLGLVDNASNTTLTVKVYLMDEGTKESKNILRTAKLLEYITQNEPRWLISRISSLSTMYREYQSLMSFTELNLKDALLCKGNRCNKTIESPNHDDRENAAGSIVEADVEYMEVPSKLRVLLKQKFDDSQFSAVMNCMKAAGITLVQGPPGTGKTTTIMGILSVLLNATPKQSYPDANKIATEIVKENIELDEKNLEDNFYKHIRLAQPWIYEDCYVPWYDEVTLAMEDLELPETFQHIEPLGNFLRISDQRDLIKPKRVLVCAPSNAAIDEILQRMTKPLSDEGGLLDQEGIRYTPNIVRVGPNIRPELIQYSLEHKASVRAKAKGVQKSEERTAIKRAILKESSIVCTTLSMCGSRDLISFDDGFDTVVIDEASQGVELSTLIPLRMGCQRLILVGDHLQLSATVISRTAINLNYDISLFQRLEAAGYHVNVLSVQYRMHPEISKFPSKAFYNSKLKDAENIHKYIVPPIPWYTVPIFKPVVFFTINSAHEVGGGVPGSDIKSLVNTDEASFVVQLLDLIGSIFSALNDSSASWTNRVAVISPYKNQVQLLRHLIKKLLRTPEGVPCPIDVNTVDGFQGREKDFVIFSAVRAHVVSNAENSRKNASVGFLADERRLNVALTRARMNLWIVGNGRFLMGNPHWYSLWQHCSNVNSIFNVNFERFEKSNYVKPWLSSYLKRNKEAYDLFNTHLPGFINKLKHELAALKHNDMLEGIDQSISQPESMEELEKLREVASRMVEDFDEKPFDEGNLPEVTCVEVEEKATL